MLPRVISTIVNPDGSDAVSPRSSVISGDVEALDKLLTFLFCGALGALSDVVGRKPLMAYSAFGFALTCFLQASAKKSLSLLYIADLVDGASSCMNNICQAYVTDASLPGRTAVNLGIFQAFGSGRVYSRLPIIGRPRRSIRPASTHVRRRRFSVVNGLIILGLAPESLPPSQRKAAINWREANPPRRSQAALGRTPLMAWSSAAFFLIWFGNACINSIFGNYVNHLFGWGSRNRRLYSYW